MPAAIDALFPRTHTQVTELMNVLDRDRDGTLDYSEFLGGFTIATGGGDDETSGGVGGGGGGGAK